VRRVSVDREQTALLLTRRIGLSFAKIMGKAQGRKMRGLLFPVPGLLFPDSLDNPIKE
jgi:hypothetical protein